MVPGNLRRVAKGALGLAIDLRTFTYIDILQPQLAGFLQTVAPGFLPLPEQALLYVEVSPGISINQVTDIALKRTSAIPGMQIVERAFGVLELHSFDQGQVRAAGAAILEQFGLQESDRMKPKVMSSEVITGIDAHQGMLVNRMRHGNMLLSGETLWVLEVHPAGYALIAANEAEKAADVNLMEVLAFGAFGRLWLGGGEAEIEEAVKAATKALEGLSGRENTGR